MRRSLLLLCSLPALGLADEPGIQPAVDAARKREELLKTVSIDWKVTTFVQKGGRMDADPVGLPLPRADRTVESTHRLVLDGPRFRVEHDDPGFRLQVPSTGDGIQAFDGERSFHRAYLDGRDTPAHLLIEGATVGRGFGGVAITPLTQWCRGSSLRPFTSKDIRSRIVGRSAGDGPAKFELQVDAKGGDTVTTFSFDPDRDYLLQRIRSESAGTVEDTKIEYRERPGSGWIPNAWTTTKTRDGDKLVHRIRAEVTDVRVNQPVAAATFRLDPLPGEHVVDERKHFRVRADGTLEEISLDVPPPPVTTQMTPAPTWPGRTLVRYVLLPGLLVAAVGFIVLRRRRQPHTPSQ